MDTADWVGLWLVVGGCVRHEGGVSHAGFMSRLCYEGSLIPRPLTDWQTPAAAQWGHLVMDMGRHNKDILWLK